VRDVPSDDGHGEAVAAVLRLVKLEQGFADVFAPLARVVPQCFGAPGCKPTGSPHPRVLDPESIGA